MDVLIVSGMRQKPMRPLRGPTRDGRYVNDIPGVEPIENSVDPKGSKP